MSQKPKYDVFVSHAGADTLPARDFTDRLRTRGLRVYLDDDSLEAGESWEKGIGEAITASSATAVLVSSSLPRSGYIASEISSAVEKSRRTGALLIPVLLDSLTAADMPYPLRRFQSVPAWDAERMGVAVDLICRALGVAPYVENNSGHITSTNIPQISGRYFEIPEFGVVLEAMQEARERREPRTIILTGSPGVGKSALAAEICERARDQYEIVWWTQGSDVDTLVADLAALALPLRLRLSPTLSVEEKARTVRNYLSSTERRYLLVVDDAVAEPHIASWLPEASTQGQILITSRTSLVSSPDPIFQSSMVFVVAVNSLDTALAEQFLWERSRAFRRELVDDASVREVALRLGGHPLALSLAASWMASQPGLQFEEFLNELDRPSDAGAARKTREWRSLLRSLELALTEADRASPISGKLFGAVGMFAEGPIPLDVLVLAPDDPYLRASAEEVEDAIRVLSSNGLIQLTTESLQIHSAVREFARSNPPVAPPISWSALC